jgi:SAM-dependent methyltransferase
VHTPNFDRIARLPDDQVADLMGGMAAYRDGEPFVAATAALHAALPDPPARVCELGPGAGDDADALGAAGYDVVGVDLRPDLRHPASAWPIVVADAAHLPFADRAFDAVIANRVLHHTPDPHRVLRQARDAVRTGGVVAFTFPSFATFTCHRPGANDYVRRVYTTPGQVTVNPMSVTGAMDLARDAGLAVTRVEVHSRQIHGRAALAYAMGTTRVTFTHPEAQAAVDDLRDGRGWATLDLAVVIANRPAATPGP